MLKGKTKIVLIGQKDAVCLKLNTDIAELREELLALIEEYRCSDVEITRIH